MFDKSDIVSIYTRAEAIADGVLVDVTKHAKRAGINAPVALTSAVWDDAVEWTDDDIKYKGVCPGVPVRLASLLWMLNVAIVTGRDPEATELLFDLNRVPRQGTSTAAQMMQLKAVLHGGDDGEPVITVLLPNED